MKKLLVFLFIGLICGLNSVVCCGKNYVYATEFVEANYNQKIFRLDTGCDEVSILRSKINSLDDQEQVLVINKILSMGFSLEDAMYYVFPKLKQSINKMCDELLIDAENSTVEADNNNCQIIYKNAKNGIKVDKNSLLADIFAKIKCGKNIDVKTLVIKPEILLDDIKKRFVLVSTFETNFASSSTERKSNIVLALKSLNGKFINSGEIFSFNGATGVRNSENGYKSAKIIENGEYVDGFGGGVCQVSTTLYNACLQAGLDVVEVHNHSLPTGYVKPAFDAMVSMGSSDLRIKNNTKYDFLITTSSNHDVCKVCLYGVNPGYDIKTRSEKYEEILPEDIIEKDASKYADQYGPGEHRISYGTKGYKAKGYLDYYKDGVLIKSVMVRDSTYKPKNGVVLIVEESSE